LFTAVYLNKELQFEMWLLAVAKNI